MFFVALWGNFVHVFFKAFFGIIEKLLSKNTKLLEMKKLTLQDELDRLEKNEKHEGGKKKKNSSKLSEREQKVPIVVASRYHNSRFKEKPITLFTKTSKLLTSNPSDFKFKFSEPIRQEYSYKIIRAKHKPSQTKLFAKVYKKVNIDIIDKEISVNNELLIFKNLKNSNFFLSLFSTFEDKKDLYLMFERYNETVKGISGLTRVDQKMAFLSHVLIAFIQINAHGVAVCEFHMENVVKDLKGNFKIFNLCCLTTYGKNPEKPVVNEFTPPELRQKIEANSKIDSWSFDGLCVHWQFLPVHEQIRVRDGNERLESKILPRWFLDVSQENNCARSQRQDNFGRNFQG
jgi:hypothetical protein